MSEGRRVPIGILRQSEELADSLVAECDALRARVKELEAQLLDEQDNYAGAMADLKHFEPLAGRMRAERDTALDSLHALAEWRDGLERLVRERLPGHAGRVQAVLCWLLIRLEGGWDATGGDDGIG